MTERITLDQLRAIGRKRGIRQSNIPRKKILGKIFYTFTNENDVKCFVDKLNDHRDLYCLYSYLESEMSDHCKDPIFFIKLDAVCEKLNDLPANVWAKLTISEQLSHRFMSTFQKKLNFNEIIKYQHLSTQDIISFQKQIDFSLLIKHQHVSERVLVMFNNKINFNVVIKNQAVPEWILGMFYEKIDPILLIQTQTLSHNFMTWMLNKVNPAERFRGTVEHYYRAVLWPHLIKNQRLSKDTILFIYNRLVSVEPEEVKKIFGSLISKHQEIDTTLLEMFQEIVPWSSISRYQVLQDEDLIKFCDVIDFIVYQNRGFTLSQFVKENLPKPFDEIKEEVNCPICLDLKGDGIILKKCKHSFCQPCILGWLRTAEISSCPICRMEVPYKTYLFI